MRSHAVFLPALAFAVAAAVSATAAETEAGKRLVEEKHCETCHHNKTLGDAKAIYLRKDRKVNTLEQLKARVALCNSELSLQMFPDEEEQVVDYLDATYYKFRKLPTSRTSAAPVP